MKMSEAAEALEFTPEQVETADELVPGWRELTPIEFQRRLGDAAREMLAEAKTIQETLREFKK